LINLSFYSLRRNAGVGDYDFLETIGIGVGDIISIGLQFGGERL
jgi:hypothetical protein